MREVIAFKDAFKRLSEVLALVKKGQITDAKFKLDHVFTTLKYAHELGVPANIYNYYLKRLSVLNQMFLDYIAGKERDLAKMVRHIQYTLRKMFYDIMDLYLRRIVKKPEEFKPLEKKEEKPPERLPLSQELIHYLGIVVRTAAHIVAYLLSGEYPRTLLEDFKARAKVSDDVFRDAVKLLERSGIMKSYNEMVKIETGVDDKILVYALKEFIEKGMIRTDDYDTIARKAEASPVAIEDVLFKFSQRFPIMFDRAKMRWRPDFRRAADLLGIYGH